MHAKLEYLVTSLALIQLREVDFNNQVGTFLNDT